MCTNVLFREFYNEYFLSDDRCVLYEQKGKIRNLGPSLYNSVYTDLRGVRSFLRIQGAISVTAAIKFHIVNFLTETFIRSSKSIC